MSTEITITVADTNFVVNLDEAHYIKIGHDRTTGHIKVLSAKRSPPKVGEAKYKQLLALRDPETKRTMSELVEETVRRYTSDLSINSEDLLAEIAKLKGSVRQLKGKEYDVTLANMLTTIADLKEQLEHLSKHDVEVINDKVEVVPEKFDKIVYHHTMTSDFELCFDNRTECAVPSCCSPVSKQGLCAKHHARYRKHGNPYVVKPMANYKGPIMCLFDGCAQQHDIAVSGFCQKHDYIVKTMVAAGTLPPFDSFVGWYDTTFN